MIRDRRLLAAVLGLAVSSCAAGAEKRVQLKDLPAAVQKTVQEQAAGATIIGLSKEREGGTTRYEIETQVNGRTRDLLVDSAGAIVEIEEEVSLDAVPAAVKSAFTSRGRVMKVEAVTKATTLTYEAQIDGKGKKSEVVVDVNGRLLAPK